ncbi:hypothetical protein TSEDIMI_10202 [Tenacibaculum sediminilitoris]|uniref:hypothetical protein n=1 Tax=Tenacibaculum sediminilitoris TaxID=1820334 RepID=UPI00389379E1
MKRKILFFIFLLVYCLGFSQSELYVLLKEPQNLSSEDGHCPVGGGDYGFTNISYTQNKYDIPNNEVNIILNYKEAYNDDPSDDCGGSCGQYQDYCSGTEVNTKITIYESFRRTYEGPDPILCGSENCLPISYHAVLLPKITAPADRRCERDTLFKQYSDGQNHNVTGLVWEYYSTTGWKEIPSHKNRFPLNVSLLDVFGTAWRSKFNGNLQLRFKFTAPFTNEVVYSFNTYTIQLTECSPELQSLVPHKTKCSYSEDGSFTLSVDRNLVTNEKLITTLYYKYTTGYNLATDPQKVITSLTPQTNGTYKYTWSLNLAAGWYKIKYQAYKGTGGIATNDPSWASLEFSEEFEIIPSTNVTFNAKKLNDENCFNTNDGKIEIFNVGGEINRTFEYQVNNNSWIPFNGSSTIIGGLGIGNYKIKLRDNEKCTAK